MISIKKKFQNSMKHVLLIDSGKFVWETFTPSPLDVNIILESFRTIGYDALGVGSLKDIETYKM